MAVLGVGRARIYQLVDEGRLQRGTGGKGVAASALRRLAAERARATPAPAWAETHQRMTFHCPSALRAAIEAEVARTGRSKSVVIVDAVRTALGVDV